MPSHARFSTRLLALFCLTQLGHGILFSSAFAAGITCDEKALSANAACVSSGWGETLELSRTILWEKPETLKYSVPREATDCDEYAPHQLQQHLNVMRTSRAVMSSISQRVGPTNFQMKEIAEVAKDFYGLILSLPDEICVGPNNKELFDALEREIPQTNAFYIDLENQAAGYFKAYANEATQILRRMRNLAAAVDQDTISIRELVEVVREFNVFNAPYKDQLIYGINEEVEQIARTLQSMTDEAFRLTESAYATMESKLVGLASTIEIQVRGAGIAFNIWETRDGQTGYDGFKRTYEQIKSVSQPRFELVSREVPPTPTGVMHVPASWRPSKPSIAPGPSSPRYRNYLPVQRIFLMPGMATPTGNMENRA